MIGLRADEIRAREHAGAGFTPREFGMPAKIARNVNGEAAIVNVSSPDMAGIISRRRGVPRVVGAVPRRPLPPGA